MAAAPVLGIGMGFRMTPSGTFVVSNVQGGGPAERVTLPVLPASMLRVHYELSGTDRGYATTRLEFRAET
eukprot:1981772-Rhodomonas_salina.2